MLVQHFDEFTTVTAFGRIFGIYFGSRSSRESKPDAFYRWLPLRERNL